MLKKSLAISMIVLVLSACNKETNSEIAQQSRPPAAVSFITIKNESILLTSELNGRVVAALTSQVRPQISGIIQERLFNEGDYVKKGDLLYKIDDSQYKATYEQALATLQSAEADLSSIRLKYERYTKLSKEKAISQQDVDDARSSYEKIKATVAQNKALLKSAKINLDYTSIRAPISGNIGLSSYTPGALVTANQAESLTVIRQLDPIYVDITEDVSNYANLQEIRKKNESPIKVKINFNNKDYPIEGILKTSEMSVDEQTGSVILRSVFTNPNKMLIPGLFVKAQILNAIDKQGIQVPQRTVMFSKNGNSFVFILGKENKIEKREVSITESSKNFWIINKGLIAGDKIIDEGLDKIREGDMVNATESKGE